jgi:four helix bundle protein
MKWGMRSVELGKSDANLRERKKQFALRTVRLFGRLPQSNEAQIIGKQLLRSGTSVATNYRESCRARSDAEMLAKLGIVEQELDESILWLELLGDAEIVKPELLADLLDEADQLLRMTVSSIKTIKSRR